MNAMRHRISGSDSAEDDDIPQCPRCGALVHDPCETDEKAKTCELPDFCFPKPPLEHTYKEALQEIAAMDANGVRADDLGRAARIARAALTSSAD